MAGVIETEFGGVKFRSRTEARWAVFFDALGVGWEYEPEAYSLPHGAYLPDFRLAGGIWVEVKPPGYPTDQEIAKCHELAAATDQRAVIVCGSPDYGAHNYVYGTESGFYFDPCDACKKGTHTGWHSWNDIGVLPALCLWCGAFGLAFMGWGDRVHECPSRPDTREVAATGRNKDRREHPRVRSAATAARAHRFWEPR